MKKISTIIIILGLTLGLVALLLSSKQIFAPKNPKIWSFQSIDTMKYSRDLAREKATQPLFDLIIERQIKEIASTGATHVAIATPYDEEFYPMLQRWVKAARENHLNVWFRGNFSGWEGWFEYKKITREAHMEMTKTFIEKHPEIFQNGDVFTACPECENGGPGDPRTTGDLEGHRKFLIDEYGITKTAFKKLGVNVASNYDSMNLDVAKLIMDETTTNALDGVVTVDHYVRTPERINSDINFLAQKSGGKIVLGEFGAPIPDITGDMTEMEQSLWLDSTLNLLSKNSNVKGINYWVGEGGSTQLWDGSGKARQAVRTLIKYYNRP